MIFSTRRCFLKQAAVIGGALSLQPKLLALPLGLPLGLQLYSVREQLPKDYEATLQQIAALGYKEMEAAGFYGHNAAQVSVAMKSTGLRCVSAHYAYDALAPKLDELIEFGGKIGLSYIICSWPGHKPAQTTAPRDRFTLDDWHWNAEQFNQIGEKVRTAGMHFGYHNHRMEFAAQDGIVPYDELLRLTDPKLVTMEMDCGWVVVGGKRPEVYMRQYPQRFSMLHVKDFKTIPKDGSEAVPAELGLGSIDYRPIFAAAKKTAVQHIFVEQEAYDMPWVDALKVDAAYMRDLKI